MRQQWILFGLLAVLLGGTVAAALHLYFSGRDGGSAASTVEVILKSADVRAAYWQSVSAGAKAAAKDLGLHLEVEGPLTETDSAGQLRLLEQAVARKPKAILIAPVDERQLEPWIPRIEQAGIRLLVMDAPIEGVPPGSLITNHHEEDGRKSGHALADAVRRPPVTAVISDSRLSAVTGLRERGVNEALAGYGGRLLGTYYHGGSEEQAYKITKGLLADAPELNGIIALNEAATLGAAKALRENSRTSPVTLIGFDSSVYEIQLLEAGIVHALVVHKPFNMGYMAVQAAVRPAFGRKSDPPLLIESTLVTQDTMYTPENQKLLFPFN
ncbi:MULTISPECIES: substrate-binding domain-containing protein [Paenibacillus]|uniref:substrate-binding domain-containing protein n=1 Tax=Paenibacillus TaxID=44249 RepID=UPI0022B8EB5B|nr:substrate-binding domain-containing protein [Paenibacillus caseinilyticus]MCZ8519828.1 substrate-binding domain-containing protein [Paenibacillus caseinilyticus]